MISWNDEVRGKCQRWQTSHSKCMRYGAVFNVSQSSLITTRKWLKLMSCIDMESVIFCSHMEINIVWQKVCLVWKSLNKWVWVKAMTPYYIHLNTHAPAPGQEEKFNQNCFCEQFVRLRFVPQAACLNVLHCSLQTLVESAQSCTPAHRIQVLFWMSFRHYSAVICYIYLKSWHWGLYILL